MAEIRNPNLQSSGNNPGGGGAGSSSFLVLMLLMFVVLMGWDFLRPKPAAPNAPAQNQTQQQQAAQTSPQQLPAGSAQAALSDPNALSITAAGESETVVENAAYRIHFSNRGAQITHWILKQYSDSNGRPLDLVQQQAASRFGHPLAYYTYEPALTKQLNEALYQPSATGSMVVLRDRDNALTFHYAQGGVEAIKTIRFDQSYVLTVETKVTRNGVPVRALVSWPAGLGDMEEFIPGQTHAQVRTPSQLVTSMDGKQSARNAAAGGFLFWHNEGVSGNATLDAPFEYAGVSDLYFAAVFLPEAPYRTTTVTLHNAIDIPSNPSDANSEKRPADLIGLAVGDQSGFTRVRLYGGPKQLDVLKTIHASGNDGKPTETTLAPLVQFGMWGFIAKPMYLALRALHNALGIPFAWGWAIIIVTFIINLCMFPTRWYMLKSSLKMARIQPQVEALKRKYSNLRPTDPKRAEMNTEMMALYKREGVNMYGSCLPMLIQMPLLYAIYRVLANAVELRQAHWFWLHDLSSPDPLYILPVIVIVGMLVVQLISPAPGMDPAQRKMMAIMMPAIFGFTMIHFASGLALYWGTGNLINLIIQLGVNNSSMGKELKAIAAKRAAKKAGPKVIQGRR